MRLAGLLLWLAGCVAAPVKPDDDAPFHDADDDGFAENDGDCDDRDSGVSPDAVETCNDRDDDCDDLVDEDASDAPRWYPDLDGDLFGDSEGEIVSCDEPAGDHWVQLGGDCDDTPGTGAALTPGVTWYADLDGDTFGDPATGVDCEPARASDVKDDSDCDDTDPTEKPGVTWYADADGDGFGNAASSHACDRAAPTDVLDATDCDDADPDEKPGVTWYADADGDSHGNPELSHGCDRASPTDVLAATDCDDTPGVGANRFPGNLDPTVGDGFDDDCDAAGRDECYADVDGDGHGGSAIVQDAAGDGCHGAQFEAPTPDDCDEGDAATHPSAFEIACDDKDNDCDEVEDDTCIVDAGIGGGFGCAIDQDGVLSCWGANDYLQATPPLGTFTRFSASYNWACAIDDTGALRCWGKSEDGRLPPPSGTLSDVSLTARGSGACAIHTEGTLTCWAYAGSPSVHSEPTGTYVGIASDRVYACAVKPTGEATCWGDLNDWPCDGWTGPPANVDFAGPIACGYCGCAAVARSGDIRVWGSEYRFGEAVWGTKVGDFVDVDIASYGSGNPSLCGLKSDGTLECWGSTNTADHPGRYLSVDHDGETHCAVDEAGDLECW